jgi:hypothetical protein
VDRVTAKWFEVVSTSPVPLEAGKIPGASGMVFYSNGKSYVRVEVDQEAVVRLNGDTSDFCWVSPQQAGDPEQVGWFEKYGPVWQLDVANKSSQVLNVSTFSAEA